MTRQRLYLEAMEDILPGITKVIITPDTGGNLLEFLPLPIDNNETPVTIRVTPTPSAEPVPP